MNAAILAVAVLALYAIGYRFYSRFLADRVFGLRRDEPVPSRLLTTFPKMHLPRPL